MDEPENFGSSDGVTITELPSEGSPSPRSTLYAVGSLPALPGMTRPNVAVATDTNVPQVESTKDRLRERALQKKAAKQAEEEQVAEEKQEEEHDNDEVRSSKDRGTTITASSFEEKQGEMEKAGLMGARRVAVWVGNIPTHAASDTAIRFLFGRFGEIRRVYLREKQPPSRSWCLLMFRGSEAAKLALAKPPLVELPKTGEEVQLIVEAPQIKKALTKAVPGALGAVIHQALDDAIEDDGSVSSPTPDEVCATYGLRRVLGSIQCAWLRSLRRVACTMHRVKTITRRWTWTVSRYLDPGRGRRAGVRAMRRWRSVTHFSAKPLALPRKTLRCSRNRPL